MVFSIISNSCVSFHVRYNRENLKAFCYKKFCSNICSKPFVLNNKHKVTFAALEQVWSNTDLACQSIPPNCDLIYLLLDGNRLQQNWFREMMGRMNLWQIIAAAHLIISSSITERSLFCSVASCLHILMAHLENILICKYLNQHDYRPQEGYRVHRSRLFTLIS